jgi:hypothetical protein
MIVVLIVALAVGLWLRYDIAKHGERPVSRTELYASWLRSPEQALEEVEWERRSRPRGVPRG